MRVALFGGTFDPPHLAHQQIPQHLLEKKIVDDVWFVPVREHAFQKKMSSVSDRLAMLELLQVPIERYELENAGPSYSYDTLKGLAKKYRQHSFSWVIGADNLRLFHTWGEYLEMLQQFPFYVYPRAGFPMEPLYPGMIPLREMEEVTVSSTEIRDKVRHGETITELVDQRVAKYITDHELYR